MQLMRKNLKVFAITSTSAVLSSIVVLYTAQVLTAG